MKHETQKTQSLAENLSAPDVESAIQSSSKFHRVVHKILPRLIEDHFEYRLQKEMAEKKEKQRREEIGPKGRIVEDARYAVQASLSRSMLKNHREKSEKGIKFPLKTSHRLNMYPHLSRITTSKEPNYPNSIESYSKSIDEFLDQTGFGQDNILGRMAGDRFAFAIAEKEDGSFPAEVSEEPNVYLISRRGVTGTDTEAVQLSASFLDALSEEDTQILEKAASHLAAYSANAAFTEFTDRHI